MKRGRILKSEFHQTELTKTKLVNRLKHIVTRVVLYRDVLAEARKRLLKEKRLTSQTDTIIRIQLATLNAVVVDCVHITVAEGDKIRKERIKEVFEKEVTDMMRKIAPRIIVPPKKKEMSFKL